MIICINMLTNPYESYCSCDEDHFNLLYFQKIDHNKSIMSFYVELKRTT